MAMLELNVDFIVFFHQNTIILQVNEHLNSTEITLTSA